MYNKVKVTRKRPGYSGRQYCQGICENIKVGKPFGDGYSKGLVLCARCSEDAWMPIEAMIPHPKKGIVCPCCNFRPRTKTKHKKVSTFEGY